MTAQAATKKINAAQDQTKTAAELSKEVLMKLADENIAHIEKQLISHHASTLQTNAQNTTDDKSIEQEAVKCSSALDVKKPLNGRINSNFNLSFNNSFNTSFATNNNNANQVEANKQLTSQPTNYIKTSDSNSQRSLDQPAQIAQPTVTVSASATDEAGQDLISHGPLTLNLADLEKKLSSQIGGGHRQIKAEMGKAMTFEEAIEQDGSEFAKLLIKIRSAYEDFIKGQLSGDEGGVEGDEVVKDNNLSRSMSPLKDFDDRAATTETKQEADGSHVVENLAEKDALIEQLREELRAERAKNEELVQKEQDRNQVIISMQEQVIQLKADKDEMQQKMVTMEAMHKRETSKTPSQPSHSNQTQVNSLQTGNVIPQISSQEPSSKEAAPTKSSACLQSPSVVMKTKGSVSEKVSFYLNLSASQESSNALGPGAANQMQINQEDQSPINADERQISKTTTEPFSNAENQHVSDIDKVKQAMIRTAAKEAEAQNAERSESKQKPHRQGSMKDLALIEEKFELKRQNQQLIEDVNMLVRQNVELKSLLTAL